MKGLIASLRVSIPLGICSPLFAQTVHTEVEPNSNKSQATVPSACLSPGDVLSGLTTGTSTTAGSTLATTVDYWRIQTCVLSPGIYRHQLVLTTSGAAGHTGQLRGLNQTGVVGVGGTAGTTDNSLQNSSTATAPPRMNQWYGFGLGEQLYYRVAGTASTTANYDATFSTSPVTPAYAGLFQGGSITISALGQGHNTDTDMWVYDGSFHAIPGFGNDDPVAMQTSPSSLTRTFTSGTYYVAISNFNVANDQVAASDDGWVTGNLCDFPDVAVNSSTAVGLNCQFSITDSSGIPVAVPVTKTTPFELLWVRFDVTGGTNPITPFCFGDGTQATACPCGNTGSPGAGCDNSIGSGGAVLSATGTVSPDTVSLTSTGELGSALSIFLQGDAEANPGLLFGDGVRCAAGSLKRLYVRNASGGTVTAPVPGDNSITTMSAILGDPIAPGSTRYYQVYYRDPLLTFCPMPPGNSWNVSGGLRIVW